MGKAAVAFVGQAQEHDGEDPPPGDGLQAVLVVGCPGANAESLTIPGPPHRSLLHEDPAVEYRAAIIRGDRPRHSLVAIPIGQRMQAHTPRQPLVLTLVLTSCSKAV